jgi:stearoyl-CoA desaturase (delta-9 desaturase)
MAQNEVVQDTMFTLPSLKDVMNKLPNEVFQIDTAKALTRLMKCVLFAATGYVLATYLPWFYLPVVWIFLGLVYTGLSSVAYDCGRGSFSKYGIVNYVVGNIVSWPLLIPFESWRLQWRNTNFRENVYSLARSNGWWLSTTIEFLKSNFDIGFIYKPGNRRRILVSMALFYTFVFVFFPLMLTLGGFWGLCKFWLIPWILYHFWMSSFFRTAFNTQGVKIPITDDTHVRVTFSLPKHYPAFLEFITNDVNYVLSSTRSLTDAFSRKFKGVIPNHNLKESFKILRSTVSESDQFISDYKFNYIAGTFFFLSVILSAVAYLSIPLHSETLVLSVVWYFLGMIGVGVGYHRYYCHKSFEINSDKLKMFLLTFASSTFVGDGIWWCNKHLKHHLYNGTDRDPFYKGNGFLYSHIGWLLWKNKYEINEEVKDFKENDELQMQRLLYVPMSIITGIIMPTLIAGFFWNDYLGGFFYASAVKSLFTFNTWLFSNSLPMFFGKKKYSHNYSARDSIIVSFLTFGDASNNFHHEYYKDYRNGYSTFSFDPCRWTIFILSKLGLVSNLRKMQNKEIKKSELVMKDKGLEREKEFIDWGPSIEDLPEMTWKELKDTVKNNEKYLVVIDNIVCDVTKFLSIHPGGPKYLKAYNGRDATDAFNGKVYDHSNAGRNVKRHMYVARIVE